MVFYLESYKVIPKRNYLGAYGKGFWSSTFRKIVNGSCFGSPAPLETVMARAWRKENEAQHREHRSMAKHNPTKTLYPIKHYSQPIIKAQFNSIVYV